MNQPLFDSSPFELPNDLKGLNPKAKITLFKALVKDPADTQTYPVYDSKSSEDGRHVYHSKDNKQTFEIYQDDTGHTYVKQYNNDGDIFHASGSWKAIDKGQIKGDAVLKGIEGQLTTENKASAPLINPSLEGSLSTYNYANREIVVSNENGSAIAKEYTFDANKVHSKLSAENLMEGKGLAAGYDLAKGSYKLTYLEEPKVGINPNNPDHITFSQGEYGIEASAGLGAKIEIQKPADILKINEKIKFSAGLGASPSFDLTLANTDYIKSLPESDFIQLQNDAIKSELSGKSRDDLERALQISDPDAAFINSKEFNIPTLTDEQRTNLEQRLNENQETLSNKYRINSNEITNREAIVSSDIPLANTDSVPESAYQLEASKKAVTVNPEDIDIYKGFPNDYIIKGGEINEPLPSDDINSLEANFEPSDQEVTSTSVDFNSVPDVTRQDDFVQIPQSDNGGETEENLEDSLPGVMGGELDDNRSSEAVEEEPAEGAFEGTNSLLQQGDFGNSYDLNNAGAVNENTVQNEEESGFEESIYPASDDTADLENVVADFRAENRSSTEEKDSVYNSAQNTFNSTITNPVGLYDSQDTSSYFNGLQQTLDPIGDSFPTLSSISDFLSDQESASGPNFVTEESEDHSNTKAEAQTIDTAILSGTYENLPAENDGTGSDSTFDGTGPGGTFDGTGPETTFDGTGPVGTFEGTGPETTFDGTGPHGTYNGTGLDTIFDGTGPDTTFDGTPSTTFDGTGESIDFDGTGQSIDFDGTGPDTIFDGTGALTTFDGTGSSDTIEDPDFSSSEALHPPDAGTSTLENSFDTPSDSGDFDESGSTLNTGFMDNTSSGDSYNAVESDGSSSSDDFTSSNIEPDTGSYEPASNYDSSEDTSDSSDSSSYDSSEDTSDSSSYDSSGDTSDSGSYDSSGDTSDSGSYDSSGDTSDSGSYDSSGDASGSGSYDSSGEASGSGSYDSSGDTSDSGSYDSSGNTSSSDSYDTGGSDSGGADQSGMAI